MAYVVKDSRGRSPFWTACYNAADGRRLKKSTKEKNRRKALEIALALERAERLGDRGEATEARLRELLAETLERVSDGADTLRNFTAEGWITEWLNRKRPLLAAGSLWSYERATKTFIEHLGRRAKLSLAAITAGDVQGWINAESARGMACKSVGVSVKVIRAAFRRAIQEGLITGPNPAECVDLPKGVSVERETFTAQELDMLIAAAEGDWKTVTLIGVYCGQRLRDCADVRWGDVDLHGGFITFRVKKAHGKALRVPIHPALREHLEGIAGDDPNAYLAPSLCNRETGGAHGISAGFQQVMKAAGVAPGEARSGKRRMTLRGFHALRHTAATRLLQAGVDAEIVRRITGHADHASFQRYLHPDDATLSGAIRKMKGGKT